MVGPHSHTRAIGHGSTGRKHGSTVCKQVSTNCKHGSALTRVWLGRAYWSVGEHQSAHSSHRRLKPQRQTRSSQIRPDSNNACQLGFETSSIYKNNN